MRFIQSHKRGIAAIAAASFAALAAWISQSTIGPSGVDAGRVAVVPLTPVALGLAAAAGATMYLLARRGAALAPLALLAPPLLAWIPIRLPAVVLAWAGPVAAVFWAAALGTMAVSAGARLPRIAQRPALTAGVLAFVVYALAAWSVAPSLPGGDEPHYLIITQSLLFDHDLKIENNHQRADYRAYFGGDLRKPDYYRRGRDGQIYSIHAPGVAVLVAPAFALGGYRGVVIFLLVLASGTAALTWRLAYAVTGRADAAWFACAALVASPPMLLNAFTVYPDAPGAFFVSTGVWALIRCRQERATEAQSAWPWFWHGAALAVLPWLHTRFALLAGCTGALVLLGLARTRNPAAKASAFLTLPSLSALAWIGFFVAIYGVADPAIPYRGSDLGSPSYIPGGLGGLLFDQTYGLFASAPVLAVALIGLVALARTPGPYRSLPLQLLFIAAPYVLTITHFAMWWGGFSTPARFLVPLVPPLVIGAAAAWTSIARRGTRAAAVGALVSTAAISVVLATVDRGRTAYLSRESVYAPWLEWVSPATDLGRGMPAFFARVQRGRPGTLFFVEIAVWLASVALAVALLRLADRTRWTQSAARLASVTVVTMALASALATTIVWHLEGVDGANVTSSTMAVLRRAVSLRSAVILDVLHRERLPFPDLTTRSAVRIRPAGGMPGRGDRALVALPRMPAGEYRVQAVRGGGTGWLMIGIGRDQYALVTLPLSDFDQGVTLRFPVDVRAILVRGDEGARTQLRELNIQPVSIFRGSQKAADGVARRAVRYGASEVFFMDENSYPEPNGFWVGGARASAVVVSPDRPAPSVVLAIRNAPVENRLHLDSGTWHEDLRLTPGEEERVDVPIDTSTRAALVRFQVAGGFRPAANDPASRDERFLGMWISMAPDQNLTTPPK
jgi:hypothetical protein